MTDAQEVKDALDDWHPIETAPKDGRNFRGAWKNSWGNWRTGEVLFIPKHSEEVYDTYGEDDSFDDHNGTLYWPEGFYMNCDDELLFKVTPSHWMPLPNPPSVQK